MVQREFKKWQLAFIVGLIFIIPVIIVFQYTKADITIEINPTEPCFPQEDDTCFFRIGSGSTTRFEESDTQYTVFGERIVCFRTIEDVAEPMGDIALAPPDVQCNDVGIFDKENWRLAISHADLIDGGFIDTLIFSRIGT